MVKTSHHMHLLKIFFFISGIETYKKQASVGASCNRSYSEQLGITFSCQLLKSQGYKG